MNCTLPAAAGDTVAVNVSTVPATAGDGGVTPSVVDVIRGAGVIAIPRGKAPTGIGCRVCW